jgi:hypothetical protein
MTKRIIQNVFFGFAALSVCTGLTVVAQAGNTGRGKVDQLYMDSSLATGNTPTYSFTTLGVGSPRPSCVTNGSAGGYVTKDKAIYDMVVAAKLAGRDIAVWGRNACTIKAGVEDVQWVSIW